jgi:hypothetical protein
VNLVATSPGDILDYALGRSSSRAARGSSLPFVRMGGTFAGLVFIKGSSGPAAGDREGGGTVDR